MDNIFFDVMEPKQRASIQEIKANKQFTLLLINDLDKVFQTNYMIEDLENGVIIKTKTSPNSNWYNCFSFVVDEKGIEFHTTNLGHRKKSKNSLLPSERSEKFLLGDLYKKYKNTGTKADKNFLCTDSTSTTFGKVEFVIPINRIGDNLKESLKDIVFLMEQNSYKKRF